MKAKIWVTGLITVLIAALATQHVMIRDHRHRITELEAELAGTGAATPARQMHGTSANPTMASKSGPRSERLPGGTAKDGEESSNNRLKARIPKKDWLSGSIGSAFF